MLPPESCISAIEPRVKPVGIHQHPQQMLRHRQRLVHPSQTCLRDGSKRKTPLGSLTTSIEALMRPGGTRHETIVSGNHGCFLQNPFSAWRKKPGLTLNVLELFLFLSVPQVNTCLACFLGSIFRWMQCWQKMQLCIDVSMVHSQS